MEDKDEFNGGEWMEEHMGGGGCCSGEHKKEFKLAML